MRLHQRSGTGRLTIAFVVALASGLGCTATAAENAEADRADAPQVAPLEPIAYGTPNLAGKLEDKAINESSGIARSYRTEGLFWTHNDSGDKPRLYAFDSRGKAVGTFDVPGAKALDWEDMTSFEMDGKAYLIAGDVGDNARKRKHVVLYLIEEPAIPEGKRPVSGALVVAARLRYTYEDGPQNCECVAFHPATRTVLLMSKWRDPSKCQAYTLVWPKTPQGATDVATAKAVAKTPIIYATGMDLSPDGRRVTVCNYHSAYEYTRRRDETWATAFGRKPKQTRMPRRMQGEAICYGADGQTLYLTSERYPSPLWEIPVATRKDGDDEGRGEQGG
jgi:hypothetical protein